MAVVLVALGIAASAGGGSFVDDFRTPGTQSQAAMDVLDERFPAAAGDSANVVFAVDSGTLRGPERRAAIDRTVEEIRAQPHVTAAPSPFERESGLLSENGRIAYVPVQYDGTASSLGAEPGERLEQVAEGGERAGLEVSRNGAIVDQAEQTTAPVGELIGVAVAMIVLTLVFRSVAAMALTLISSLIALAGGLLLLQFGSAFADFPSFAPTLGVMLGLGAGIDYALLIVGRYREQLASGDSVGHAARVANATAGTSVVAAGAIVVVAIAGLLATGIPFVGRMGIGSAIVIAMVAVGAVTVLPTLMGAFARRLRPKRPEHVEPSRRFGRWAGMITRRPLAAAIAGGLVLVLLAVPFASLRLGQPDDGNDRQGSTTRVAYDRLAEGFGPGFNGPLVLAATTPGDGSGQETLSQVERAVAADRDVAVVSPAERSPAGDAAVLTVIPKSSPQDERTTQLVDRLRDEVLPAATRGSQVDVYVGGATATLQDLADKIASRLPIFIAMVVGLSVLLLMAVFRSLWVPLVSGGLQPALDRRRLRRGRARLPGRSRLEPARGGRRGADRVVRAAVHVRDPVRPVDGLQRLPAVAHPRGVHARCASAGERGARDVARRQAHPRRRRDHDERLPRIRHRSRRGRQDDRLRARRRDPDRRPDRADGGRAGGDDAAGRPGLDAARLAGSRAPANLARGRARGPRSTARAGRAQPQASSPPAAAPGPRTRCSGMSAGRSP